MGWGGVERAMSTCEDLVSADDRAQEWFKHKY